MKCVRLSESEDIVKLRRETNKIRMKTKGASSISIDNVIALFLSTV